MPLRKANLLAVSVLLWGSPVTTSQQLTQLDSADRISLKVCDGLLTVFKSKAEDIWPGYNLAQRPLLLYRPEKWALLLNPHGDVDGFTKPPQNWPNLKHDLRFHLGRYDDLVGQLSFDVRVGANRMAAVPVADAYVQQGEPVMALFAFVVHEAFHQYQNEIFREADSLSEERYPIQDRDNTGLAFFEMQLLKEALEAREAGRRGETESCLRNFVAVRDARWRRNEFVRSFEQHEELYEGTAKYVEVKSLSLMKDLEYDSALKSNSGSLAKDFRAAAFPGYLLSDFSGRITNGSVSPSDMPRNRIYPVGAALGFLLDDIDPDWKKTVQARANEVSLQGLLRNRLGLDEGALPGLLAKVKIAYRYDEARKAADRLVTAYEKSFQGELAAFQAQGGHRIQIKLNAEKLSRSRSTGTSRWTVDGGRRSLCRRYNIYTLRSADLRLTLHDAGVLEEQDWDAKTKTVTFFVPRVPTVLVDGATVNLAPPSEVQFQNCEFRGDLVEFSALRPGSIRVEPNSVQIDCTHR